MGLLVSRMTDKIIEKTMGVKTIYLSEEEFVRAFGEIYLSQIQNDSELNEVMSFINPSIFNKPRREKKTQDGRYRIISWTQSRRTFPLVRHWIWINDDFENVNYEYKAVFWGSFKKRVQAEIMKYRNINSSSQFINSNMNNYANDKIQTSQQSYNQNLNNPIETPVYKFCPYCGNKYQFGIKFCSECGNSVL